VRLAPVVAPYRAQLGSILGLQGSGKRRWRSFQKAVDLDANDLNFRRETAAVQWQLGLMAPAEKNLQFVLTKHPGDSGAILLLGLVKEKTGEYAERGRSYSTPSLNWSPRKRRSQRRCFIQSSRAASMTRFQKIVRGAKGSRRVIANGRMRLTGVFKSRPRREIPTLRRC
jgi:hypothetical protein